MGRREKDHRSSFSHTLWCNLSYAVILRIRNIYVASFLIHCDAGGMIEVRVISNPILTPLCSVSRQNTDLTWKNKLNRGRQK